MRSDDVPESLVLQAALLRRLPGVVHGFTTRRGGVSPAPRDSLHLALRDDDDADAIVENWRRAARALGGGAGDVVLLDQVHGNVVVEVSEPTGPLRTAAAADAALTCEPGVLLAVRTADCVPVLLAGPGVVAAAHAGWRGVVQDIVGRTVQAMVARTGCAPEAIVAAVGPHASVENYETGPEVVDALVQAGLVRERVSRMGPRGREHADLRAAVVDQLEAAGVREVDHVCNCTIGDPDFFSHRRDGAATGRQASIIGLVAECR